MVKRSNCGKITKSGPKPNKQRNYARKNAFEYLIWGKNVTCVKFSGAFDGIIKNT